MDILNNEPEEKQEESDSFREEQMIEEELKPMKNEKMILENPKIKGMDYHLSVEPI